MPIPLLASGRYSWYFAVLEEGEVGAGDTMERDPRERNNIAVMQRAIEHEGLPDGWRVYFQQQLAQRSKTTGG